MTTDGNRDLVLARTCFFFATADKNLRNVAERKSYEPFCLARGSDLPFRVKINWKCGQESGSNLNGIDDLFYFEIHIVG